MTADGLQLLNGGEVWIGYGMDGRRVSHNFAAACTSASRAILLFYDKLCSTVGKCPSSLLDQPPIIRSLMSFMNLLYHSLRG